MLQRESVRSLGVAFGLIVALLTICMITMVAWTSYNKRLARKAPRRRHANRHVTIHWERDTLGRPLDLPAAELACTAPEVRVVLQDGVKAYIAVDPEEL